jgi:asparagine synthase (glutamine-hydrolysing)
VCGIVGLVAEHGGVDAAALARAMAALRHRGPDGEGRWIAADRRAALGHVRLALVDRTGGAQPIASEDGAVVAAVSGEFYEHAALRAELIGRGHVFRSRSDSEVLVHLYEERGAAAIEALSGEFSLLLWDARDRSLLAARDRFGVRPLCYARLGEGWVFASEAKALLAAGVPAAWDEEALWQATQMQYHDGDRTLFQGIGQVEPGQLMVVRGERARGRIYWDLEHPREGSLRRLDDAVAAAEVREALASAVRIRLEAEAPICFQLSGGVDSSAVVALAARSMAARPVCYTVAFERDGYDERAIAAATAAALGAEHRLVEVRQAALLAALPAAIGHSEGLAINGHVAAKFLLSRAVAEDGFRVMLTGEGADELFAGYAHLRGDAAGAEAGALGRLRAGHAASAGLMLPEGEGLALEGVRRRLGFVPTWMAAKATLGRRVAGLCAPEFVRAGADGFARFIDGVDGRQLAGRARVHQSLYLWIKGALAGYILRTLGDAMEMAHAVEGRVPFLDHRLAALAGGLAIEHSLRGEGAKFVLREALRGLVPEEVRTREKHPFLAPPLCVGESELVQDTLRGREDLPSFVDRAALRRTLDALPATPLAERRALDPALMLIASAAILQQRYRL